MLQWTSEDAREMVTVLNEFPRMSVLLLGDFVLDRWVEGTIHRVSREAPVFVVEYETERHSPGGAANTAVQLRALDAEVTVLGWLGDDPDGHRLLHLLQQRGVRTDGIVFLKDTPTVVKTRFIAGSPYSVKQQVMRLDRGHTPDEADPLITTWVERFHRLIKDTDCVVISDYGYGIARAPWLRQIIRYCQNEGIPVFGDSRFHLSRFEGATALTPNEPEFSRATGRDLKSMDTLHPTAVEFRRKWGLEALLVTRGSAGMLLVTDREAHAYDVFGPEAPVDVTGAGDTVLAVFSLASTVSRNYELAARLADIAGGIAVMHKGAYPVPRDELRHTVEQHALSP